MQQKSAVLVVDADLLGLARIEGAAGRAGRPVAVARSGDLADGIGEDVGLVILDLDRGREPALDALDVAAGETRVVMFVSHVDEDLARRARERGYETLPRGRFWRSLDDLMRA